MSTQAYEFSIRPSLHDTPPPTRRRWSGVAVFAVIAALWWAGLTFQQGMPSLSHGATPILRAWPLRFEPNIGVGNKAAKFLGHGPDYSLALSADQALIELKHTTPLRLVWLGADSHIYGEGLRRLPGISNYLLGADPGTWRRYVPTYGGVRFQQIYPGVDLSYYGTPAQLEYDLVVAPGRDPQLPRMRFPNADSMKIGPGGELHIVVEGHDYVMAAPRLYQDTVRHRNRIAGGYRMLAANEAGFWVDRYNRNMPLVIDPVMSLSSYLGGGGDDELGGMAVGSDGSLYLVGQTTSANFPESDNGNHGGADVIVAKLNPTGTAIAYTTYLGGSGTDRGFGIAVDASGNAYIVGDTTSPNLFPTSSLPSDTALKGSSDAFVAKLSPDGATLVYGTYLGGSADETGRAIQVDSVGNAYVAGGTTSPDFPTTTDAPQRTIGGAPDTTGVYAADAFIAKLNGSGDVLVYSTYLGGSGLDSAAALALTSTDEVVVVGATGPRSGAISNSDDFPVTSNAYQRTFGGPPLDAFVAKLNTDGTAFDFATYLGGGCQGGVSGCQSSGWDQAYAVAVDGSDNIYIGGVTSSSNFPVFPPDDTLQASYGGGEFDGFVTKMNSAGGVIYSTYLGGSGNDQVLGLAVPVGSQDVPEPVVVVGETDSTNFPLVRPMQLVYTGGGGGSETASNPWGLPFSTGSSNGFAAELSSDGTALGWSSYLGGSGTDVVTAAAFSGSALYVAGTTNSSDFPTTAPVQANNHGGNDLWFARLDDTANTNADIDLTLAITNANDPVPITNAVTYQLAVSNKGTTQADGVVLRATVPEGMSLQTVSANQGSCDSAGATVHCALGSISAGADAQVNVSASTNQPGKYTFTAQLLRTLESNSTLADKSASQVTTYVGGGGSGTWSAAWLWGLLLRVLWRARVRRGRFSS